MGIEGRDGAIVALRAVKGMSLVVFPEDGVRAALPAGSTLDELDEAGLAALRAGAAPLTPTERFLQRGDEWWLVQQTGPAWADQSEAASDACGILFTRLDGSQRRYAIPGRPPGSLPDDDALRDLLATALHEDA